MDPTAPPARAGWARRWARILYAVARDLGDGMPGLRAAGLVYTTLLSLVPMLAVAFSVLKGLGVHSRMEPMLLDFLAPMGDRGADIATRIIGVVENVRAGVLGAAGMGLLLYTVFSLMQKVERAFNDTWRVTRRRPLPRRLAGYLSVLLVGPLAVFAAMAITAAATGPDAAPVLAAMGPLGAVAGWAGRLAPYVLIIAAFALFYVLLPNTTVEVRSALVGAAVAGLLWQAAGWAFAAFVLGAGAYTAVYSVFATLMLFLIWLYLGWLILLVGAGIAFYHQHPGYLDVGRGESGPGTRAGEKMALLALFHVGNSHGRERRPWTAAALARRLGVPGEATEAVLDALEHGGLVRRTGGDPPAYVAVRPLEETGVGEALDAVRAVGGHLRLAAERLPGEPAVERLIAEVERRRAGALEGMTLADLAAPAEPAGGTTGERARGGAPPRPSG